MPPAVSSPMAPRASFTRPSSPIAPPFLPEPSPLGVPCTAGAAPVAGAPVSLMTYLRLLVDRLVFLLVRGARVWPGRLAAPGGLACPLAALRCSAAALHA